MSRTVAGVECSTKLEYRRKVAGAITSLVNTSLQLECTRVLHTGMLVPPLMYGSETMVWRRKELRLEIYRWIT